MTPQTNSIPEAQKKKCPKCLTEKTFSQFAINRTKSSGVSSWCKECTQKDSREWRSKNLEIVRSYNKKWNKINAERIREALRLWLESHPGEKPPKKPGKPRNRKRNNKIFWEEMAVFRCKYRASKKGVPFAMGVSDFLDSSGALPRVCPIFPHIKLDYSAGPDRRLWASVDRIVPELGYVSGNVCIISAAANTWKNNGSNPQERRRIVQIMLGRTKRNPVVDTGQGSLFAL